MKNYLSKFNSTKFFCASVVPSFVVALSILVSFISRVDAKSIRVSNGAVIDRDSLGGVKKSDQLEVEPAPNVRDLQPKAATGKSSEILDLDRGSLGGSTEFQSGFDASQTLGLSLRNITMGSGLPESIPEW